MRFFGAGVRGDRVRDDGVRNRRIGRRGLPGRGPALRRGCLGDGVDRGRLGGRLRARGALLGRRVRRDRIRDDGVATGASAVAGFRVVVRRFGAGASATASTTSVACASAGCLDRLRPAGGPALRRGRSLCLRGGCRGRPALGLLRPEELLELRRDLAPRLGARRRARRAVVPLCRPVVATAARGLATRAVAAALRLPPPAIADRCSRDRGSDSP